MQEVEIVFVVSITVTASAMLLYRVVKSGYFHFEGGFGDRRKKKER
jgi:hypothetical protein